MIDAALAEGMKSVRSLLVLTGAGMSAESGVPTFRGPGGLWEGHRPEDLATPEAFDADAGRVWRWYRWRLDRVKAAQPHAGHRALAWLEARGGLEAFHVVTQNVDGLHQRAGCRNVIELHGSIVRARCSLSCGNIRPADEVDPADIACACGGRWRPDVVWFGEMLPYAAFTEAGRLTETVDMAWVIGTSNVVYPAAALPRVAARRGITVVEVNPDPTPLTGEVPYSYRMTASEGLDRLARAWAGARGSRFEESGTS